MFGRFVRPLARTMLAMTMISGWMSIGGARSHDQERREREQDRSWCRHRLAVPESRRTSSGRFWITMSLPVGARWIMTKDFPSGETS